MALNIEVSANLTLKRSLTHFDMHTDAPKLR